MKLLRETIQALILENQKAVDSEIMWPKIEAWMEAKCEELGVSLDHFETDFLGENKFTGEWYLGGAGADISAISEPFSAWFRARGWNMLRNEWEYMEDVDVGRLHIVADKQANPKSSNHKWTLAQLGYEENVLLHVTTKENWKRIKRKGFVPRSQSSDGVEYGAQRNYFFTMAGSDWNDNQENIMNWFRKMFAEDKRGRMAGLDAKSDLVLIKIDTYAYEARNIVANFYIDTEFGFGSGGVETRGLGFDMEAIYTPTHIPIIPYAVRSEEL